MNTQKIIFVIICLEVFLVPLFFLPFTNNVLDFNKEFLFIILTAAAVVLWFAQGLKMRQFRLTYVPLFLLAPAFFFFYTISTLVSEARRLSFLGLAQAGVSPSWFGILFLVLFYFLFINYVKTERQITLIVSLLILAGIISLSLFAVNAFGRSFFPWEFAKVKSFNSVGSVANFSVFLGLVAVLAAVLFLNKKQSSVQSGKVVRGLAKRFLNQGLPRVISGFFLIFIFLCLATLQIINFKVAWLVLIAVSFVFLVLVLSFYHALNFKISWLWLIVLFFVLALSAYFLDLPSIYELQLPAEVSLSPQLSGTIALKATFSKAKNFLVGSGPSTFQYAFSQFRPQSFNKNLLWQWRFNRPAGYFWEILATSGWLGLMSLVVFILLLLISGFFILLRLPRNKEVIRSLEARLVRCPTLQSHNSTPSQSAPKARLKVVKESTPQTQKQISLLIASLSCFIGLVVAFLVLVPCFVSLFMFWLLAGLISVALISVSPKTRRKIIFSFRASPRAALIVSFASVLVFSFAAFLVIGGLRIYLASAYGQKAGEYFNQATLSQSHSPERRQKLNLAEQTIKKAMGLNKDQAQYLMLLARLSFNQALEEVLKPESERDLRMVSNYLALAVNQSKRATDLAPQDAPLWETRADLLRNTQVFTNQVKQWTIEAYERVGQLEPSSPLSVAHLGWLYYEEGQAREGRPQDKALLTKGQDYLEKALSLKPDFLEVRLGLISVFEALGGLPEAIRVAQQGLQVGTPAPARLFYELGRLYYNQFVLAEESGDQAVLNLAVSNFEKTISLNPGYANALYSLSLAYEKQALFDLEQRENKLGQALDLMQRVSALNPEREDIKQKIKEIEDQLL